MADSLIIEHQGHLGVLTLNRPTSLNTLSLELIVCLRKQLQIWSEDPQIRGVCIQGRGPKSFCAGGDVKVLAQKLDVDSAEKFAYEFFWNEYHLDYEIHTYPKPILVIGHGITMGGGIGLLAGATCRVVTPSTLMAMPEITIGLFTDVGGSYFLSRMPHSIGLFLGLTATRFSGRDALYLGLADVLLSEDQIPSWLNECEKVLAQEGPPLDRKTFLELARKWGGKQNQDFPPSLFETHGQKIEELMTGSSLKEVMAHLEKVRHQDFPWNVSPFFQGSPMSAHLIFEQFHRGKSLSLRDCFEMELNMSLTCCKNSDFKEGVRALLIEKDKNPRWNPEYWDEVHPLQLIPYFERKIKMWESS